jgi:hypothetical protein
MNGSRGSRAEESVVADELQMPNNQSKNEGNDDQVFWAYSMIAAAEYKLPDPPQDQPGWLAMTQSVFNQFLNRYNKEVTDGNCGGGLRWQVSNPCGVTRTDADSVALSDLPMAQWLDVQKHRFEWRALPTRRKTSSVHAKRNVRALCGESVRLDVRAPPAARRWHSK